MKSTTDETVAQNPVFAAVALLFNALIWGLIWWPLRRLQELGLHPLWAMTLIYGLTFAVTLCLFGFTFVHWCRREPLLWLLGVASAVTNVCFNWGVTAGDVVRVVLLFYMMPVWAVFLGWWVLGERLSAGALLRTALALFGVLVVLKTPQTDWPVPQSLADWLGVISGFSFALTNVLLRRLRHVPATSRMMIMFASVGGFSALLAFGGVLLRDVMPPGISLSWPTATLDVRVVLWVMGVGLLLLMSNMALQYGASRLSSSTAALIMLSEVIFASLSSVWLDAAQMTPHVALGGVLIVVAATWSALGSARQHRFTKLPS